MSLPSDYLERVYAGVLGKVIGVYLGRPFEGWTYDQIMERLGEITYYVHERLQFRLSSRTTTSRVLSPFCARFPTTATGST